MSTRTYTLPFTGASTLTLPAGVFFFVQSASAAVTIRTRGSTTAPISFEGVGAGLKFGPVAPEKRWTYLDVTSSVAQVVSVIVSDDAELDVANTVNVAGAVMTTAALSTVIDTPARVSVTAAQTLLVAANPARKRVVIQNVEASTANVNVGTIGQVSAVRGFELQPGAVREYETSAAIYGFAVTGTQTLQVEEQT